MISTTEVTNPADASAAHGSKPPESRSAGIGADCGYAGRLFKHYFKADPLLGIFLVVIKLGMVSVLGYATVDMQSKMAAVTSALAERDGGAIPQLLFPALAVFGGMLLAAVLGDWIGYTLNIRMRTTSTELLLGKWLARDRCYRLDRLTEVSLPEMCIRSGKTNSPG